MATERLVEIINGLLPYAWLSEKQTEPAKERQRKTRLQLLAVVAGMATAWLSSSYVSTDLLEANHSFHVIVLGLLASGGSGFWNSVSTYTLDLKNSQQKLMASKETS